MSVVHIATIGGRQGKIATGHRLRDAKPPALCAVSTDKAVAGAMQSADKIPVPPPM